MSGNNDVKRMWVGAKIDEPIHTALLRSATHIGRHPSEVVERAIEEFIVSYTNELLQEGEDVDDKLLVTMLALEDRSKQNQMAQLKTLAYSHMQFPTEESAERLEAACDAANVPVETLMEEISKNQEIAELVSENGSIGSAEMWLLENMEPGKKYPMRVIVEKGETAGHKEHALKAAKLNLGIESKRESRSWAWVLPDNNKAVKRNVVNLGNDDVVF